MKFVDFYRKVRDREPFDWQVELADQMAKDIWHESIVLPPSTGKTTVLDIWYWSLLNNIASGQPRYMPLRLWYVVDRKLIVDQAYDSAVVLHTKMTEDDELRNFAKPLMDYLSITNPLVVARSRGGLERSKKNEWLTTPNQPVIISSTVDQYGSRLLFRGYGAGNKSRPIHAGMASYDSLILLDEAHISQALSLTVDEIINTQPKMGNIPSSRLIELSATGRKKDIYQLNYREDPKLKQRLAVSRPVKFVEADNLADTMVRLAIETRKNDCKIVAVICNTVSLARRIFNKLEKYNATLLIGRIRNWERFKLRKQWQKLLAGRDRDESQPLFVVATQTIEVGADFDFDAIISQSAPLDCLIQRFGRMDRLGSYGKSVGYVVHKEDQDDKIYGSLSEQTFKLFKNSVVNFPVEGNEKYYTKQYHTPKLTPPTVNQLGFTNPDIGMSVDAFLHGTRTGNIEFSVIFRDAITEKMLKRDKLHNLGMAKAWLKALPPHHNEVMVLQKWCIYHADATDMEAGLESKKGSLLADKLCLRYSHNGDSKVIKLRQVRHGDLVVIPTSTGLHDEYGWNSDCKTPVEDISRLHPRCILLHKDLHGINLGNFFDEDDSFNIDSLVRYVKREIAPKETKQFNEKLEQFVPYPEESPKNYTFTPDYKGIVLKLKKIYDYGKMEQTLKDHSDKVAYLANLYAKVIGLDPDLCHLMKVCGDLHDLGKTDPRFQKDMYHDKPISKTLLAKSGSNVSFENMVRPKYWRHELQSVQMVLANDLGKDVSDYELLLHLIATHHGWLRPFAPICYDEKFEKFTVNYNGMKLSSGDSYVNELWRNDALQTLAGRYNMWGLAFLEAIFRLADWTASNI